MWRQTLRSILLRGGLSFLLFFSFLVRSRKVSRRVQSTPSRRAAESFSHGERATLCSYENLQHKNSTNGLEQSGVIFLWPAALENIIWIRYTKEKKNPEWSPLMQIELNVEFSPCYMRSSSRAARGTWRLPSSALPPQEGINSEVKFILPRHSDSCNRLEFTSSSCSPAKHLVFIPVTLQNKQNQHRLHARVFPSLAASHPSRNEKN